MEAIDQAKQIEKQTYLPPRGQRAPGGERPPAPPKTSRIYPPELRLKLAKLYLEESIPAAVISRESGVMQAAILAAAIQSAAQQAFAACATVKIEIRREVTLARQAFDAHMRIKNDLAET